MTYDEVTERRICGTHQYGAFSIERRLWQRASCLGDNGSVCGVPKTGLPVHGGGAKEKAQSSSGAENRVYRKTPRKSRVSDTACGGFYRGVVELFSLTSPEDIFEKKGVWPESAVTSTCFTTLIAWAMKRSHNLQNACSGKEMEDRRRT